jgi:hypothetical protein
MQALIPPVEKDLLLADLRHCRFVKKTRKGENEIYRFYNPEAPHLLFEVGRLRELTFRAAGGGTGKAADIDDHDTGPFPCEQLIVWDPAAQEIVGGYRLIHGKRAIDAEGQLQLSSAALFSFSEKFLREYLPFAVEAGRSWIQPQYQCRSRNRKGIFSLDNLWEGLGAYITGTPDTHYLFGKVTVHTSYPLAARKLLLNFIRQYFPDPENLAQPHQPLLDSEEDFFAQQSYEEAYRQLKTSLRNFGENIPPLINAYINLSRTMKSFGSTINPFFGNVIDTGILVTVEDILPEKKARYF